MADKHTGISRLCGGVKGDVPCLRGRLALVHAAGAVVWLGTTCPLCWVAASCSVASRQLLLRLGAGMYVLCGVWSTSDNLRAGGALGRRGSVHVERWEGGGRGRERKIVRSVWIGLSRLTGREGAVMKMDYRSWRRPWGSILVKEVFKWKLAFRRQEPTAGPSSHMATQTGATRSFAEAGIMCIDPHRAFHRQGNREFPQTLKRGFGVP